MQAHSINHCARFAPTLRGKCRVSTVSKGVQHRRHLATFASSVEAPTAPSVPQRVQAGLQHRQAKLADLTTKLDQTEARHDVVKEVLQEFQGLNDQVHQLAQHLAEADSKVQAKAAEKAAKKERKAAEKAAKKERKAAEKAAKKLAKGQETEGFVLESDSESDNEYTAEVNHAAIGTTAGDTTIKGYEFGQDQPQNGGQIATSVPQSSAATAPVAVVSVCQGSSCREKGSETMLEYIKKTAGAELNVVPCKCLGKCEQAPSLRVRHPEQKPVVHTGLGNSREVSSILQDTKAQYAKDMMKSFAAAN